jgi:hypothetical protein
MTVRLNCTYALLGHTQQINLLHGNGGISKKLRCTKFRKRPNFENIVATGDIMCRKGDTSGKLNQLVRGLAVTFPKEDDWTSNSVSVIEWELFVAKVHNSSPYIKKKYQIFCSKSMQYKKVSKLI